MPKKFLPQIVSANHLLGGHVIYLTAENNWSADLQDARVAQDPETAAVLLEVATGHEKQIVGPYLMEIAIEDDLIQPVHFREQFRLDGPSIELPAA